MITVLSGKVDYSETEPSRWTLIIEFFDDKNIIVRPKGSSETGGKCGPGLGTFTESEIKYVCKFNSPNDKGEIFNLNRFSGLYEKHILETKLHGFYKPQAHAIIRKKI